MDEDPDQKSYTQKSLQINGHLGPWKLDKIHNLDCLIALKQIPSNSIDIAITSPPYWGQRTGDGIGGEEDPREYIDKLVNILAEVMRCLKPTGTLWLNLGDAYNTPLNWRVSDRNYSTLGKERNGLSETNSAYIKNRPKRKAFIDKKSGWLKYGNLLGIPYRVVIGLSEHGYLLRGEVIWVKSRPLPEGKCRRPHRRHESIYIIAKDEGHSFQTKPPIGSVWKLVQTPNRVPHFSTFPIDLPLQCIKAAGIKKDSIVLDPFMGSGTTAKAATISGCHFLGFEIDKQICEMANNKTQLERLENFLQKETIS